MTYNISILLSLSRLLPLSTKAHCPGRLYTGNLTALTGSNCSSVWWDVSLCAVICTLHLCAGYWEVTHSKGRVRKSHQICQKQNVSWYVQKPEQSHSVIKWEMLIALNLTKEEREEAIPTWLLHHPMGLPRAGPQGCMPLTLPVPGKGTLGHVQGSTHLAAVDCRGVWDS